MMEPETASERFRQHRAGKRKKLLRQTAILGLLCLSLWGGHYLLLQPWFSFGAVYITGTEKISREEVLFLTRLKEPVNLFLTSSSSIRELLINDIRIKNADVTYELPNILRIDIEEKEPFLYAASNYGYVMLDSGGMVMSAGKSIKDAAAPILSGISNSGEFVGDRVGSENVLRILAFLELLDRNTRKTIAEINVSADGKVKLFDLPGRWYLLGGIGELRQKAAAFAAITKEVFEKNLSVEFVDLSYSKPYIKIKRQGIDKKTEKEG